ALGDQGLEDLEQKSHGDVACGGDLVRSHRVLGRFRLLRHVRQSDQGVMAGSCQSHVIPLAARVPARGRPPYVRPPPPAASPPVPGAILSRLVEQTTPRPRRRQLPLLWIFGGQESA